MTAVPEPSPIVAKGKKGRRAAVPHLLEPASSAATPVTTDLVGLDADGVRERTPRSGSKRVRKKASEQEPKREESVASAQTEAPRRSKHEKKARGASEKVGKKKTGRGEKKAAAKSEKKASAKSEKKAPRRRSDLEVEVKLRCESLDVLTSAGLDVVEVESRHFEDNWVFELPDGKLRKGQYLRVRYRGDGNGSGARREGVLTYKGKSRRTGESQRSKNKGKKVREEIETSVGQPNKVVKILKRLGLKRSFRYQKYRSVHRVTLEDDVQLLVMFDETPIGNFLELEGDSEVIERVAQRIGYKPSDFVAESYVEMQLARCISRGEPLEDMTFAPVK